MSKWVVVLLQPGDYGEWQDINRVVGLFDSKEAAWNWAKEDYNGLSWAMHVRYVTVVELEDYDG